MNEEPTCNGSLRPGEGLVLRMLHCRLMSFGLKGIPTDQLEEIVDELIRVGLVDGKWRVDHEEVLTTIIEDNLWLGQEGRKMAEVFCIIRHYLEDILK